MSESKWCLVNSITALIEDHVIIVTYSHIKDTSCIRDGMNICLVILTGAGDMEPVGENTARAVKHQYFNKRFILQLHTAGIIILRREWGGQNSMLKKISTQEGQVSHSNTSMLCTCVPINFIMVSMLDFQQTMSVIEQYVINQDVLL